MAMKVIAPEIYVIGKLAVSNERLYDILEPFSLSLYGDIGLTIKDILAERLKVICYS